MKRRLIASALGLVVAAGCARTVVFDDRPIVWRVNDDKSIPEPEEREYNRWTHYGDAFLFDSVDRGLALRDLEPAQDTNALDEVPDSSWFENRIGRYELTPTDVVNAAGGDPPVPPFTVKKGKVDGANPGFVVEDATKRRFLLKMDPDGYPEMQSSNAAISSRLFWAAGYHVPSEHVVSFQRSDLVIDPKATYDEGLDEDLKFTDAYLDKTLKLGTPPNHGVYRGLASLLLKGKPKGGFADRGLRSDDPNDTVPHQHRRVLRGLQVFCAWLDHTDFNPQNTLDMYVEEDGRKFLKHHLVDFGETLGAHAMNHPWISYSHFFDGEHVLLSAFSFGLWKRPWEDEPGRPFQSVGLYFPKMDPRMWREAKPYYAFREMTPADAFWAARIIMRFDRPMIEAAVGQAKMSDTTAAGYLIDTLLARRRGVGFAYMTNVTALDRFDVSEGRLCAVDLSVLYGLSDPSTIERIVDGEVVERSTPDARGKVCFQGPASGAYTRYLLRTVREDALPAVEVHARGGDEARILGIVRRF